MTNLIKKYLSAILSLILLVSNTSVFAQRADIPQVLSPELKIKVNQDFEHLNSLLSEIEGSAKALVGNARASGGTRLTEQGYKNALNNMSQNVDRFEKSYKSLLSEVRGYSSQLKGRLSGLAKGNVRENVLETLASRYYGSASLIEPSSIVRLDEISVPEIEKLKGVLQDIVAHENVSNGVMREGEKMLIITDQLKMTTKFEIESEVRILSDQSKNMFESLSQLSTMYSKEQIWERAFSRLTPEQQEGVKLILKAGKQSKTSMSLARDIGSYLAKFKGGVRPNLWNTLKLSRQLKNLTPEARIKYVDEMTKLKPGEMSLARDISTKPRVAGKFMKIGAPLMIVGAVLTAVSITEVNAQNAFPEFANIRDKKNIKDAIENDEEVSVVSALRWYTDPTNESVIERNNAHYMSLVSILFSLAQADEDKDGILEVLNEIDPDPGIGTAQVQDQIEQEINISLEQMA